MELGHRMRYKNLAKFSEIRGKVGKKIKIVEAIERGRRN